MAHAVPRGNPHAAVEDIRRVARGVMRHRISLNFNARAEGITDIDIIDRLVKETPVATE